MRFYADMKKLIPTSVFPSFLPAFLVFASCASKPTKPVSQEIEAEQKWIEAFDDFARNSPQCPKIKHPLVAGQKSFGRFSGNCFHCRKPLGITETKINRFTQKRSTIVAIVLTCAENCKYNVCSTCAKNHNTSNFR
jgi:hypothetical protein